MLPRHNIDVPPAPAPTTMGRARHALRAATLGLPYWLAAHRVGAPGLWMHARCVALACRALGLGRPPPWREVARLLGGPMQSVRYFEFEFTWPRVVTAPGQHYLDISSPRAFPIALLAARSDLWGTLINPDARDLTTTRELCRAVRVDRRCTLLAKTPDVADLAPGSFDLITSISVFEHIPEETAALRRAWSLLRSGGRLALTVPCAAQAFEEYISKDPYAVLSAGSDGYTFWQRFYDEALLRERIFSVTGAPVSSRVFGERAAGLHHANMYRRLADPEYPVWREPYMMGEEYRYFDRVADLPGIGVIGLEFRKP